MYSGNNRHYSNPFYDRLLDDASTTYALDENKRWETMIAAEKELMETTAGMIVISQNQKLSVTKSFNLRIKLSHFCGTDDSQKPCEKMSEE